MAVDTQALMTATQAHLPAGRTDLADLVAIPSISAASGDPAAVQASAQKVADLLTDLGLEPQLLRAKKPDGTPGAPAVVARRRAPAGRPTVLLYAHHDVQPVTADGWHTPAFEATERDGRLFGRGAADDKAGVMVHVTALRTLLDTWGPDDGVGIVVFIEGEEEAGSPSFADFLHTYRDLLDCDVIVVADSDNWTVDDPSLTVTLRGLVDGVLTVSTSSHSLHSGMFGGAAPDALMVATTVLSRLWDADGSVAVPGLVHGHAADLSMDEERWRRDAGLLDGVRQIGTGPILDRLWANPAVTVTGLDVPTVDNASNTLIPSVRAKITMRIAPGQDPAEAGKALQAHLEQDPPFGAHVQFDVGETGQPFAGDVQGPVYEVARWALSTAWGGRPVVEQGVGGSIPFIAAFLEVFPDAKVLVTGVEDPATKAHGTNESLSLAVFERAATAEVLLLAGLADQNA
ncbi:MAG: dipeptidase [Actinomycetales bacterium]